MRTVAIRGTKLGEGIPSICIPITGVTKEEILREAGELTGLPFDVAEWRADWFDQVVDTNAVLEVLAGLRERLGEKAILFTFRTAREGGEKAISLEDYGALNRAAAGSGYADLVDVEACSGDEFVRELIEEIHQLGVFVITSNHDFSKTPDKEEMVRRMRHMQELGGDIPKLAVMPRSESDVLALLAATEEMKRMYADRPIITMSMAGTGVISRLCGETFGSAMTFGAAKRASAPGQMDVRDLHTVLELIHRGMGAEGL